MIMEFDEAFRIADEAIFEKTEKHLKDREKIVLQGVWHDLTYEQIAQNANYSPDFVHKDIAFKLWQKLSEALQEKVTRANLKTALERKAHQQKQEDLFFDSDSDSSWYIERSPIESDCYQEILKPGALIRIKAPKQMGKTTLLNQILDYATKQNYKAVPLNFLQADQSNISNLDSFLQWFCATVSRRLNLENQVAEYWQRGFGDNDACTFYFEEYLLTNTDNFVLGLDNVDRVFGYEKVAPEFFRLLRSWHEDAKMLELWKKLRLIIVHSTDEYKSLDINYSPFNVGKSISLPEFNAKQIQEFNKRLGVDLPQIKIDQLIKMVGGHPYLIKQALCYLKANPNKTIEEFLSEASTDAGLYGNHLREHLLNLQQNPKLATAMKLVVKAEKPIRIDTESAFKLSSMGLIHLLDNLVKPSCLLYRLYFLEHLDLNS